MSDLSFLPDQPNKKGESDLSFLPDKPVTAQTEKSAEQKFREFWQGIKKGFGDVAYGLKQWDIGVRKMYDPSVQAQSETFEKELKARKESYAGYPTDFPFKAGEFTGKTIPFAVLPGMPAVGLPARLGVSAATGGLIGAAEPVEEGESRLGRATVGAITGAGATGVLGAVSKGINVIKGPVKTEVGKLADKFGIRATLGEVKDNPLIQKMETWLEGLPIVGLQGFRKKQLADAQQASKNFMAKYIIDPNSANVAETNRQFAGGLFQELDSAVSGIKDQAINPGQTRLAVKSVLERYPDIFKKFQDTKRERILKDIVEGTNPVKSPLIQQISGGKAFQPKTLTFEEAWTLRDGLGEMIGQARKKLAAGDIDQTAYSQLKQLYSAVNRDIDNWAESIGRADIRGTINAANDAYKQYVVKYDILRRAYDKATGEVGAGEMFSPKKFSTALKSIAYKDKEMKKFTGEELQEMTGLANILQVVKRAGQFAENPPTGNRWGIPVVGAGLPMTGYAVGGVPGLLGVATLPVIGRILTTTEAGRRIVMSASKLESSSPAMQKLMNQIYDLVPKAAASGMTQD